MATEVAAEWKQKKEQEEEDMTTKMREPTLASLAPRVNWRRSIEHEGKIISPTEFIELMVGRGFKWLYTEKRGAAKIYHLKNDSGVYYTLKRKIEAEYASLLPGVSVVAEAGAGAGPTLGAKALASLPGKVIDLYDAEAVRQASRDDVVATLLHQPHIYGVANPQEYTYLVGQTRFGTGIFVVWEERTVDRAILKAIYQEREKAGLNRTVKIYGHTITIFNDQILFYQLPLMRGFD
jgi:hypothetical protein